MAAGGPGKGEAAFYDGARSYPSIAANDNAVGFALVVGFALRNALVDAGLVVYAPTTNSAHWNHFHMHIPVEDEIWLETSGDSTTHARREELIAPALRRAAGVGDPGQPDDVVVPRRGQRWRRRREVRVNPQPAEHPTCTVERWSVWR